MHSGIREVKGKHIQIKKLNFVEMQQVGSNFICFVLAVSVDAATCSDVSKCENCLVDVRFPFRFSHFSDIFFFDDRSLYLRKSKIKQNLQFIFTIFTSIYLVYLFL